MLDDIDWSIYALARLEFMRLDASRTSHTTIYASYIFGFAQFHCLPLLSFCDFVVGIPCSLRRVVDHTRPLCFLKYPSTQTPVATALPMDREKLGEKRVFVKSFLKSVKMPGSLTCNRPGRRNLRSTVMGL